MTPFELFLELSALQGQVEEDQQSRWEGRNRKMKLEMNESHKMFCYRNTSLKDIFDRSVMIKQDYFNR